jgi:hypothetical protein
VPRSRSAPSQRSPHRGAAWTDRRRGRGVTPREFPSGPAAATTDAREARDSNSPHSSPAAFSATRVTEVRTPGTRRKYPARLCYAARAQLRS